MSAKEKKAHIKKAAVPREPGCCSVANMSGHLVRPVRERTAPEALREQLREAHNFLVSAALATVPRLLGLSRDHWGMEAKRKHVVLPEQPRPTLVSNGVTEHAFSEVVNQCATLERLIDALSWIATVPELHGAFVATCNPTTSSAPRKKGAHRPVDDHDLVLEDSRGSRWRFEVSDVASKKDGNEKEKKDLISLGVRPAKGAAAPPWPSGHSFLVVSSDWDARMVRPRIGFHFKKVHEEGTTRIFEVCEGRGPS